MSRRFRGFGARTPSKARLWPVFVVLVAIAGASVVGWMRSERVRAISAWQSGRTSRIESTEGLLWPTRMSNVELKVSPSLSVGIARLELGWFPWQRVNRAYGVVIRAEGPLETFWEEARRFALPANLEVMDARLVYTDASGAKISADDVSIAPGARRDRLHLQSLQVFGATFRDLNLWLSRPSQVLEIRFAREAEDAKAPQLEVVRSPGQGVEWALAIPSQPFSEWAQRIGLKTDASWAEATFVGTGSLIVPDSPTRGARADFRFTIDNWHRPSWPEAQLLTGRSGAVALRISPGPHATHTITRVEVSAGLFSLLGNGQLSFGEPHRLSFDAQGELSCALLLAHLPASVLRDRVQAHVREHAKDAANAGSVRLELAVRAEAPRAAPLKFRWHLQAGCGLSEMVDD